MRKILDIITSREFRKSFAISFVWSFLISLGLTGILAAAFQNLRLGATISAVVTVSLGYFAYLKAKH